MARVKPEQLALLPGFEEVAEGTSPDIALQRAIAEVRRLQRSVAAGTAARRKIAEARARVGRLAFAQRLEVMDLARRMNVNKGTASKLLGGAEIEAECRGRYGDRVARLSIYHFAAVRSLPRAADRNRLLLQAAAEGMSQRELEAHARELREQNSPRARRRLLDDRAILAKVFLSELRSAMKRPWKSHEEENLAAAAAARIIMRGRSVSASTVRTLAGEGTRALAG